METQRSVLRGPKTLSIMPTYTCPAACNNCGTLSSPSDRSAISREVILSAIRQAKGLGFYNVVFTGGEPTLRWRDLLEGIRYAVSLGLPTRVVTNAHWAVSAERAARMIEELREAGINEINYSTGDEHVRFIPLDRVILAVVAALRAAIRTSVMVELREERGVTRDVVLGSAPLAALNPEQWRLLTVQESPWMPLNPRTTEVYPKGMTATRENVATRSGCDSVLQTYVVQATGRIGACCGLGMRLIPELNMNEAEGEDFLQRAVDEAEQDLLKLWIHYKGPEKILAWAAALDPTIKWEGMYAHHCQACLRIYRDPKVAKVIAEHFKEETADLIQGIWLEEEFIHSRLGSAARPARRYPEGVVNANTAAKSGHMSPSEAPSA